MSILRRTTGILVALLCSVIGTHVFGVVGDSAGVGLQGAGTNVISVDSFSGAATGSYRFAVPPGRLGMEPDLTIAYNSGSTAIGLLGKGWDFTFPYIQRSLRRGQPTFTWTDTFAINWGGRIMDLVLICDPNSGCPAGVREFRTEVETFLRIKSYNIGTQPTYWEVEDGTGRKYQFGRADGGGYWSPQVDNSQWGLNRIEDAHGNYLTMSWTVDSKVLYPKEIRYTGNSTTGRAPANRVEFAYEGRYDVMTGFLGVMDDSLIRKEIRNRLLRIRTWAGSQTAGGALTGEQIASIYFFDYTTPSTGVHDDLCGGVSCGQTTMTCPNGQIASCSNTCHPATGFCVPCEPECDTGGGGGGGGGCEPRCQEGPSPLTPDPTTPVGPSLLTEIKRWDDTGTTSLPAMTFTYLSDVSKTWTAPTPDVLALFSKRRCTDQGIQYDDYGAAIVDVNGDGLSDLIRGLGDSNGDPIIREVYLNVNYGR